MRRTQTLRKLDTGAGIALPAAWLTRNHLKVGSPVRVEVSERQIRILTCAERRHGKEDALFAKEVRSFLRRNKDILRRMGR